MALEKKEFPILEFDDGPAIINPNELSDMILPERLIITFFKEAIRQLLEENEIEEFYRITGENELVVYKFVKYDVCIIHGIVGGPACGGFYDELVGLGVKQTIFCGGGGSLRKDLTVGKIVVVDSAIRDDGMSYHYQPANRVIISDNYKNEIIDYFEDNNIEYLVGRVWTTDAFFRETINKIALRKSEGALLVEMEQASLIAISKFRGVKYAAMIYSGDDVSGTVWDKRGWHSRTELRYGLVRSALGILLGTINKKLD